MWHNKKKLAELLGAKSGTDPPQNAGSRTLFYPISIMLRIFTKYSMML